MSPSVQHGGRRRAYRREGGSGPWPGLRAGTARPARFGLPAAWLGAAVLAPLLLAGAVVAAEPAHIPIPGGLRGKACYECHIKGVGIVLPSEERPRKYSIASAWVSYLESPHGRLRKLGDTKAPMCEDCHLTREWSYILPAEHPDSPVHPDNLGVICAKCHGRAMATADVGSGSSHLEIRARQLTPGKPLEVRFGFLPGITKRESAYYIGSFNVMAYVYFFFLALTVGTLTFMSTYMVIDLMRRLTEHRRRQAGASHEEE